MPVRKHKLGVLSSRAKQRVPLLDEPPLGHLQALILKKLDDLGSEAFGYNVLEQLSLETMVWIDPSQIYSSIRRMLSDEKAYIELVGERKSPDGGPPVKIYRLTKPGRAALDATAEHHQAMAAYLLEGKAKAKRS
jgi:DNA-binding PadR family transcriptional regulator